MTREKIGDLRAAKPVTADRERPLRTAALAASGKNGYLNAALRMASKNEAGGSEPEAKVEQSADARIAYRR
ncbi:MAG: hypothetical protein LBC81_05435 [Tannerellaceae bacterium]|nr:hypothetical protein [Tannerellaceae bacterium]